MPLSLASRKPIHRLTAPDLEAFPVWEFATDEEDIEGMDETWVKPVGETIPDHESSLTVASVFKLNCGLVYPGFICCDTHTRFEVTAIALLTEMDQFFFSEATPQRHIAEALAVFGLSWGQVFPVQYCTRAPRSSSTKPEQGFFTLHTVAGTPGAA
jgi:hypothetical protein